MSKFCLLKGLCWRLARRLKATLNFHWLEDTCLAVCILNMLAQLVEPSPGASSLRTRLPEGSRRRSIYQTPYGVALGRLLSENLLRTWRWPWERHICGSFPAAAPAVLEMLYWLNLCKTVSGCLQMRKLRLSQVCWGHIAGRCMMWEGPPFTVTVPLGCVTAVSGVGHVVRSKCDLVHSQKTGGPLSLI